MRGAGGDPSGSGARPVRLRRRLGRLRLAAPPEEGPLRPHLVARGGRPPVRVPPRFFWENSPRPRGRPLTSFTAGPPPRREGREHPPLAQPASTPGPLG